MMLRGTIIGYYDSMDYNAVDYCCKMTHMPTMFCTGEYLVKVFEMK